MAEPETLGEALAHAIDLWRVSNPDVTVAECLTALESLRHDLTELLIKHSSP